MRLLLCLIGFLILVASSARVTADEERLSLNYIKATANHQFTFVMLAHPPGRQNRLRRKYRVSGLYTAQGSPALVWRVNWYSFDVIPCSDGHHLIRFGPWGRTGDHHQTMALAFYQDGAETKRYAVSDLVSTTHELPSSVSHYQWLKDSHFDDKRCLLSVTTFGGYDYQAGISYLFDAASGRIIRHSPTSRRF